VNIAVVLRMMPNLGDELELDATGADIDRDLVGMVLNEFDDQALEEAVLLKEAIGATVTAIGLEEEGMEQVLRVAYARGADRTVIVQAGEVDPYDTRSAAFALAEALRGLAPDLVLTGVQTPYDLFGQAAPYLAVGLGWPHASVVSGISVVNGAIHVLQEYAGGRAATLELQLPAVVGVQAASSPPRYVSMGRLRQAMTRAVSEPVGVTLSGPDQRSTIVSFARPEQQAAATMLVGDAAQIAVQIAALLRERGALAS